MPNDKASFLGSDFKALIAALMRFPSVGSFAGSETISLQVSAGMATATNFGTVMAKARVTAEGTFQLTGINERDIAAFASICSEPARVTVALEGTQVVLRCKSRQMETPVMEALPHKKASLKDIPQIKVTKTVVNRVVYLAAVAFNDQSRPELCCVMLTASGQAVAADQKTIAVLRASKIKHGNVAIPVTLAKALQIDDILYCGESETTLQSGVALYAMPSPVQAQKNFPLSQIRDMGKQGRTAVAAVEAQKLAAVITECRTCLASRTEVVATVEVCTSSTKKADNKIVLSARNGGTSFSAPVATLGVPDTTAIFRVPLDGVVNILPFLESSEAHVTLESGKHGELFLGLGEGEWVMFPAWEAKRKKA